MHNHWREYDDLHGLSYDISHSACGECPYVNDCRHYTNEGCPNHDGDYL